MLSGESEKQIRKHGHTQRLKSFNGKAQGIKRQFSKETDLMKVSGDRAPNKHVGLIL